MGMNENPTSPFDLLTVAETAAYLRVSKSTVWRWCGNGKLLAFRVGRGWRVRRSDLERSMIPAGTSPAMVADSQEPQPNGSQGAPMIASQSPGE
jgi:excisionase family DNA binding protein